MKVSLLMLIVCSSCCNSVTFLASGQSFQNLDFESANVPDLLPGEFGGWVSIADAIPGWDAYLGNERQTQILHNYLSLGGTLISLLGPAINAIEGSYFLHLNAGLDISDGRTPLSASIRQSGMVPSDARSLRFKIYAGAPVRPNPLIVTLGTQTISIVPLFSSSPNYTLYGGDISSFAGGNWELTLTAVPFSGRELDSIEFSPVPIPEPTRWALLGLGGLIAALFGRHAHGKQVGRQIRSSQIPWGGGNITLADRVMRARE